MKLINKPGFFVTPLRQMGWVHDDAYDADEASGSWPADDLLLLALACRFAKVPLKINHQNLGEVDAELSYHGYESDGAKRVKVALITPTLETSQQTELATWDVALDTTDAQEWFVLDAVDLLRQTWGPQAEQALPFEFGYGIPEMGRPMVGGRFFCQTNQDHYVAATAFMDSGSYEVNNVTFHDFGNSVSISLENIRRILALLWTSESFFDMAKLPEGTSNLKPYWRSRPYADITRPSSQEIGLKLMYQDLTSQTPSEAIQITSMAAAQLVWNGARQVERLKRLANQAASAAVVDLTPVLNAVASVAQQLGVVSTQMSHVDAQTQAVKSGVENAVTVTTRTEQAVTAATETLADVSSVVNEGGEILATVPNRCDVIYTASQLILMLVTRTYSGSPKKIADLMQRVLDEYAGDTNAQRVSTIQDISDSPFRLYQDLVDSKGNLKKEGQN